MKKEDKEPLKNKDMDPTNLEIPAHLAWDFPCR
jgi:hypothetical protein